MLDGQCIGFFGAGSMAQAFIHGLLSAALVQPGHIVVTNRSGGERLAAVQRRFGVRTAVEKAAVARECDVAVIACKPRDVDDLLQEVGQHLRPGKLVLSLAAGVTTAAIRSRLRPGVHVVRAMPNTSSVVRLSATGYALAPGVPAEAGQAARAILEAVGMAAEVEEGLLDAITGLSGTGPAYIYYLVETMMEAGERIGLPRETARELVLQTIIGAATMLVQTRAEPALLRQQVTSPNGTTMAAMQVLEARAWKDAMIAAIERATERSRELGASLAKKV